MAQPMKGTEPRRCRLHLGTDPAQLRLRQYLDAQARALANLDDAAPLDVGEVLETHLMIAGEALAWHRALKQLVTNLPPVVYRDKAGDSQARAEVVIYTQALDRLDRILSNLGRLNLEERALALRDRQARALIGVLSVALAVELKDEDARRRVLASVVDGLRQGGLTAAIEAAP
jgi:hypothetical protein